MADKNNSGIRFDDFVAKVHADPAKVEPKMMISGFIGRGEENGKIRIFSDQSLSHWVEANAEDVIHSQPIEGSALGGSHVWLKADAQLKPGSAAGPAGGQGGAVGGIGADAGVFTPFAPQALAGTIAPPCETWHHLPTAATVCTISPCPTHNVVCPSQVIPCGPLNTVATVCTHAITCRTIAPTICCPRTIATVCTQAPPCPTHEFICGHQSWICPPTGPVCPTHNIQCVASGAFGCQPPFTINENPAVNPQAHALAAAAPGTIGCGNTLHGCPPTNMPGCGPHTQIPNCAPTALLGCGPHTQVPNCAPTAPLGCGQHTHIPNCAPTYLLGCGQHTYVPNCAPTYLLGCGAHTQVPNCAPTNMPGCPGTSTCPPQQQQGQNGWGMFPTIAPYCHTAPIVC